MGTALKSAIRFKGCKLRITILQFFLLHFRKIKKQEIEAIYEVSGCKILFVSAKKELGLKELQEILEGKTTTVAGPSGVGKSSLINLLAPEACMETGEISKKIERGRHTTRHAELIQLKGDGYIMDTPGFSSLYVIKSHLLKQRITGTSCRPIITRKRSKRLKFGLGLAAAKIKRA